MNIEQLTTLEYMTVTPSDPFLTVRVEGINLAAVVPVGDGLTKIVVNRVGISFDTYTFLPIEAKKNTFTFVLTAPFLANKSGRYMYTFYYKGVLLGTKEFQYDNTKAEFVNLRNV